ncbi:MAG: hypothetical protein ACFFCM_10845, partial [Promethearchaeota archaeon]
SLTIRIESYFFIKNYIIKFMTEIDPYENVRQKLILGPLNAPKHKIITKLLKVFWNEEEIKILSHFESADQWNPLKVLEEKTGIPKKKNQRNPF